MAQPGQGQLAGSLTNLLTASANTEQWITLRLGNRGAGANQCIVELVHSGTNYRQYVGTLQAGETACIPNLYLQAGDTLQGSATNGAQVDYTVISSVNPIPLVHPIGLDATGAYRQGGGGSVGPQVVTGTETITAASATALAVGPNGATTPSLQVDSSAGSAVTGWKCTAAAAAAGAALAVISSGAAENGTIDAKGAGALTLNGTATGPVNVGQNFHQSGSGTNFLGKGSEATQSTSATLSAAQLLGGFINSAPGAGITLTLPAASVMVAGVAGAKVGDVFFSGIQNTSGGANAITLAAGGATLRGGTSIAQNKAALLCIVLTNVTGGSEAYTAYSMISA